MLIFLIIVTLALGSAAATRRVAQSAPPLAAPKAHQLSLQWGAVSGASAPTLRGGGLALSSSVAAPVVGQSSGGSITLGSGNPAPPQVAVLYLPVLR
jgi:hypothetical protein